MTKQNISTLTQFLQFKDSKNWVKSYLSENNLNESDLDKSEFKLIDFNGLKFHLFNQTIYKFEFSLSELLHSKYIIDIFDLPNNWMDDLRMMNFYDFLIFIRQTKIPASRLFLLNALCHEPIVKIASSGLLIQFSDIEPCMFDRIYLHFESDYPFGDFGSIPIH